MVSSSTHPYKMSFYSTETVDVGGWGKSDMIKGNVLCVRGWRKPLCRMSRFLVPELQSPRSHQHTCREHVANNTESGFDISCDANLRLDIGLTILVSSL